jgi:hypothetical protein
MASEARNGTQDIRIAAGGADAIRFTGSGAGPPNLIDILSGFSRAFAAHR